MKLIKTYFVPHKIPLMNTKFIRIYQGDWASKNAFLSRIMSIWLPPLPAPNAGCKPTLDMYIMLITEGVLQGITPCVHSWNLTKIEIDMIKALAERGDIVIKPANNGGAIVVWLADKYISEANRWQHGTPYETSAWPKKGLHRPYYPHPPWSSKQAWIPHTNKQTLTNSTSLPKSTKSALISYMWWTYQADLSCSTPHPLRITKDLNSTNAFGSNIIVSTLDVTLLYTSIPHCDSINSLKDTIAGCNISRHPEAFLALMGLILDLNCLEFSGDYFLQIHGISIGTSSPHICQHIHGYPRKRLK